MRLLILSPNSYACHMAPVSKKKSPALVAQKKPRLSQAEATVRMMNATAQLLLEYVPSDVTVVSVVLAYPLAAIIAFRVPARWQRLALLMAVLPFWTSYIIRVSLWRVILGYNGVIDSALMDLGLIGEPLNILSNGVASIVITLAHAYAPFAILPIFVALEKIDRSLLEAGQDLGETRFTTFLRVTLPLSMTGVIAAVLIVFIPTIGDYVTPNLIGGGKIPMIANMIEKQMLKADNRALGSAIAVSAMMVVGLVSVVFLALNRRYLKGPK